MGIKKAGKKPRIFCFVWLPSCLVFGLKSKDVTESRWPLKCLSNAGSSCSPKK